MRALLTVASFNPEYGGPALSVSRLGSALAERGVIVALWAPDGSARNSPITRDLNGLTRLSGRAKSALVSFAPDIVHDNGIWLPYNHNLAMASAKLGIKRVVSPRGMLEPWAFRYKGWKKRVAWKWYQKHDLDCAAAIHATASSELGAIRDLGVRSEIFIAPNGVDLPAQDQPSMEPSTGTIRTALFLSRIHPKKGLPLLIEAWASVRPPDWQLWIAGPDEARHSCEISQQIKKSGLENRVFLIGPHYGKEKLQLFKRAQLFILPTHSENFGIAIAEALAHAIPVITTTGAPWPQINEVKCGWWVPPRLNSIRDALAEAVQLDAGTLASMGEIGKQLIAENYSWTRISEEVYTSYREIMTNRL